MRTGGGAGVAGDVRPQPVDTVRYEEHGGREFDLLVFATRRQARDARSSVRATEIVREGGAYSQAALTTFGQAVAQSPGAVDRFAYRSRTLQPGACSPAEGPLLLELRAGDRRGLMTLDV